MAEDAWVVDEPERERFEILLGEEPAGFAEYRRRPGLIAFTHTEIDPAFEGRGLGSRLVRAALDAARSEGLQVLPFCPFVNEYLVRHPELADLVPAEHRARFGLAG